MKLHSTHKPHTCWRYSSMHMSCVTQMKLMMQCITQLYQAPLDSTKSTDYSAALRCCKPPKGWQNGRTRQAKTSRCSKRYSLVQQETRNNSSWSKLSVISTCAVQDGLNLHHNCEACDIASRSRINSQSEGMPNPSMAACLSQPVE